MMIHKVERASNKMATIFVAFDAGARAEEGFNPGIAHMLEHSMFKGTEKRNWEELQREIAYIGGNTNAYTSNEKVCYYIQAPYDNIESAIEILSDMCFNSVFPDEDFLKEREVVLEEEAASQDQITHWIWDHFEKDMFEGHHLGTPIIGTQDTIKAFTNEEVKDFYHKFYKKEHMIVALVSPDEEENSKALLEKYFGKADDIFKHTAPHQEHSFKKRRTVFLTRPELQQSYLWMGYPGVTLSDELRPAVSIMSLILGSGMDCRLFTEVRERRGLCYSIGSSSNMNRDTGMYMIHSSTQPENLQEMVDAIDEEVRKMREDLVSEEELQRAKNKLLSQSYSTVESSYGIASIRVSELFHGTDSLEEFIERSKSVTAEDVREAANRIFDEDFRLTMVVHDENEEIELSI
jgi:predicted Zn-dependent peptidase